MNINGGVSPKEREQETWSTVAPAWRRHDRRIRSSLAPVADRMLASAQIGPGHRVLDIASGTGEPAIPAAERVGPSGWVLGVDIAEPMLVYARQKAAERGLANIEFRHIDGEQLDAPPASFDAALCRFGLMFMPDPGACLRGMHATLRDGGRAALASWAAPNRNPWASGPLNVLRKYIEVPPPAPDSPGLFAFADPGRFHRAMVGAGFHDVRVEEVEVVTGGPFDDADEFTTFVLEVAGPVTKLFQQLDPDEQVMVREEIARDAETLRRNGKIMVPGVALVASGRR